MQSWQQTNDEEIGKFVAAQCPRPIAYLPYMVVLDRRFLLVRTYLQSRLPDESIAEAERFVWKRAWQNAKEFSRFNGTYRHWLLTQADDLVHRSMSRRYPAGDRTFTSAQIDLDYLSGVVDDASVDPLRSRLAKMNSDHRNVYRAKLMGFAPEEIRTVLAINDERMAKWFQAAIDHLSGAK
jgi:hypothetical protein